MKLVKVVICLFLVTLVCSCASQRNGYGCKGNQSWDKMVRRINSQ